MLIGIDARAASHPQYGGFKTYTEGLIQGLAAIGGTHQFRLFVDRPYQPPFALAANFEMEIVQSDQGMAAVGWREQVTLPRRSRQGCLDVMHFPCNSGPVWAPRSSVVTIHDLIPVLQRPKPPVILASREWRQFFIASYSTLSMSIPPRRFAAIITVSHHSRRQILNYYGLDERKLFVIPSGYSPLFRLLDRAEARAAVAREFAIHGAYILGLGSADPRKNLHGLLKAYRMLTPELRQRYRLVLVLNHDRLEEHLAQAIAAHELEGRIVVVRKPSTAALAQLYNAAEVFVFPSFAEGFGLPALEAMACGAPLIASNTTSLPEVTGDAALLVAPDEPEAIAGQIARVLENPHLQAELRDRGLRRVKDFSWERAARMTLDVYGYAVEMRKIA